MTLSRSEYCFRQVDLIPPENIVLQPEDFLSLIIEKAKALFCDLGTRRANSEYINFVVFNNISFWCCFIFVQGTSREFKGPVALSAVKVVMMSFSGALI